MVIRNNEIRNNVPVSNYHNVRLLVRIGTPAPSPTSEYVPPEPKGDDTRAYGWGGGVPIWRLEKKPSSLSFLWFGAMLSGALIQISNLKRENQFVKRDMGVYMIDL